MIPYPPMLAVPWPAAFDDPEWWFEAKWDGVRVIVEAEPGSVRLWSRTGRDMTATYPELTGLEVAKRAVLDGEVVALDPTGVPSFNRLQQRMNRAGGRREGVLVNLVVFDLLYLGSPLVHLPIEERWDRLRGVDVGAAIRSEPIVGQGRALFEAAAASGVEGIVAKRAGSRYQPGRRSPDWRKVPIRRRVKAVVGGYTVGEGDRSATFGALQLGLWDDGGLRYVGGVGTGFDTASLRQIRATLDEIQTPDPELVGEWPLETVAVAPVLVAMVEFLNWTPGGRLRGPVFMGFSGEPSESAKWETEGPDDIGALTR